MFVLVLYFVFNFPFLLDFIYFDTRMYLFLNVMFFSTDIPAEHLE